MHWVISHPEIEIFVAGDPQDRPVGMLCLSHRPQLRLRGRIATVDELVVTETWRRRGVGRALCCTRSSGAKVLSVKRLERRAPPHAAETCATSTHVLRLHRRGLWSFRHPETEPKRCSRPDGPRGSGGARVPRLSA